jgi:hypothetical protein
MERISSEVLEYVERENWRVFGQGLCLGINDLRSLEALPSRVGAWLVILDGCGREAYACKTQREANSLFYGRISPPTDSPLERAMSKERHMWQGVLGALSEASGYSVTWLQSHQEWVQVQAAILAWKNAAVDMLDAREATYADICRKEQEGGGK